MYQFEYTNKFKKHYQRCIARSYNMQMLDDLMKILGETGTVPSENLPHGLKGKSKGYIECHIRPNWLLVWSINESKKVITLVDTGTHSDLFK
jgi:mRNA interferase YafQ